MPKIHFTTPSDGAVHEAEYSPGQSVMDAAVNNDVPGIEGECGGEMNCGTCHVYVGGTDEEFAPPDWDEGVMLDIVEDRCPSSRLGCQLVLKEAHDGLQVTVATGEA